MGVSDAIFFWLAPTVLLIFAAAFALVAYQQDGYAPEARWASLGFFIGLVSLLIDTLRAPSDLVLMATATALHWPALAAIAQAFLVRHGRGLPLRPLAAVYVIGLAVLFHSSFIDRSPNLGVANANLIGAAIQFLALPVLARKRGTLLDTLIFGTFLFAALCYSLRAALFLPQDVAVIETGQGFWSLYNLTFYLTTGLVSLMNAVLLLIAIGSDLIHRHYQAAETDILTGLPNRRAFERWIDAARDGETEYGAVIMIDLDHFKRVNDTCGHDTGDAVLGQAAGVLSQALGGRGNLARIGGEEFAVLVFAATLEAGLHIAEDLRAAISRERFAGVSWNITGSFGVAGVSQRRIRAALRHADRAVYCAKEGGRDRVVPARPDLGIARYEAVAAE